jgi:hypothetical protein
LFKFEDKLDIDGKYNARVCFIRCLYKEDIMSVCQREEEGKRSVRM